METVQSEDLGLSRLMLGTVQFGLSYGIASRSGEPSYETARNILACAYDGGVNCLDTAPGYGISEEILGKAMAELGIADRVVVVSKVRTSRQAEQWMHLWRNQ
jgi:aryl-alcohol dehydrogenase-like predicted oxidoreductase